MPGINQATVGDGYTAKATVQDVFTATGGWFSVSNQPVVLQLQWGPNASGSRWSDEQTLGAGAFGTIPPGCTGIRFRNLVAGSAATVTAYIGAGGPAPDPRGNVWPEPALAISALGSITTSGRAPTQTVITASGAGTYNTPTSAVAILVECVGGGGAGGGAPATAAGQASIGSGGGGGAYAALLITSPASSYSFTVGAAGAPASGGNGGNGGATSFGAGPLVSAGGGGGGVAAGPSGSPPFIAAPGSAGFPTVGTVQMAGGFGGAGLCAGLGAVYPGWGGMAARGAGGGGQFIGSGDGEAGNIPGGGGGGGANGTAQPARIGGTAGSGIIIIAEFY